MLVEARVVARFHVTNGLYTIYDSWYDFGEYCKNLSYADAMARVYFACIFRPTLTGIQVPTTGLQSIEELLNFHNIVRGLRAIDLLLDRASSDPALKPPALATLLVRWLHEAGFNDRTSHRWMIGREENDFGPLRLIRTKRYADIYYLANNDEAKDITLGMLWAIESALNRYLLVKEKLRDEASSADEAVCALWDRYFREKVAIQAPIPPNIVDRHIRENSSEWSVRCALGRAMENMRVPFSFSALYHCDLTSPGIVVWSIATPDGSLMPEEDFDPDSKTWINNTQEARDAMALRYAEHIGLALASHSFNASGDVEKVMVTGWPLMENPDEVHLPFYQVMFEREKFCDEAEYISAASTDPWPFFRQFGASQYPTSWEDPFTPITEREVYEYRTTAPELCNGTLTPMQQLALGARDARDVHITYDAVLHKEAEKIAQQIAGLSNVQEAIHVVLQEQKETDNPLVFQACTRLMTALTQGTAEQSDEEAVLRSFIGSDPLAEALTQARSCVKSDPSDAAEILGEAIAKAEANGHYTDTPELVHRMFDSYGSRIIYNLHDNEAHRRVETVPPTLLMCYLDAINILDESFEKSEEAVAYGKRSIELAPTFTLAYRRCARAFMLVGDLESATTLLIQCLAFAVMPDEIAMAYYQLAYVKWKAGKPLDGIACYCKSVMTSPIYASQVSMELQELLRETGLDLIPRDEVNAVLERASIPVAPTAEIMDELERACEAAVNANLFTPASSILSTILHHRPDDALANVLRSLGDPNLQDVFEH
ncbi:MAG: hypothetical protein LUB61_01240 [Eggerthellaceae bacterium]|nr:hypothetical protein [Eggerthellaceae bacterium]